MTAAKKIYAADCETPPFKHGRMDISPFIWGLFSMRGRNEDFRTYPTTEEFVNYIKNQRCIVYAHNGGKFDFMFLLPYIKETKAQIINGRFVSMFLGQAELRDSYAIIPVPLRELGGKKEIEYWKLEADVREDHKEEIREYLYYDCKSLHDGVTAYRAAAGKQKTIASNALAFARKQGINAGKTNYRFDAAFRKFFYGGRTEVFREGTHHDIKIVDVRSSYPNAMMQEHPVSADFHCTDGFYDIHKRPFTREQIQRTFIRLECFSKGAFPLRVKNMGLLFPHEYNQFLVTGWEYLAAIDHDLLRDITIRDVHYTENTINFKPYVQHWYEFKRTHPKKIDPVNYTIGKIMMNSLYGKMAQNPARYMDYKIVPAGTPIDREHGWSFGHATEFHELHHRDSLWKYRFEHGVEWESKNIFNNVATGASITGFARAYLLNAIHTIGRERVIYCDTDSIICDAKSDLSLLPTTDKIGDWEIEDDHAPIGHFAGKKLYGILLSSGKHKIACKGSKLSFETIEKIVNGETFTWENEAPSFSLAGNVSYVVRNIRNTAKLGIKS